MLRELADRIRTCTKKPIPRDLVHLRVLVDNRTIPREKAAALVFRQPLDLCHWGRIIQRSWKQVNKQETIEHAQLPEGRALLSC